MNIKTEDTLKKIISAIEDKKGKDTVVLEVGKVNPIADYMIITTGDVPTHTRAIADEIVKRLKDEGVYAKVEGLSEGRWIAIDLSDIIVHVFLPELRDYYQLEWLWQDAPKLEISSG